MITKCLFLTSSNPIIVLFTSQTLLLLLRRRLSIFLRHTIIGICNVDTEKDMKYRASFGFIVQVYDINILDKTLSDS